MRSTFEAGRADPDNARRSGLSPVTFRPATGAQRDAYGLVRLVSRETGGLCGGRPVAAGWRGAPCAEAADDAERPRRKYLDWHREKVFVA
jgi:hypothetical protein